MKFSRFYGILVVLIFSASMLMLAACQESPKTAVPKLIKQLRHKDRSQRNAAALALAAYGEDAEKAVPALVGTLSDENAGVRTSAAYALRAIGTPQAERALENYRK